jgi:predicted membrane GTPase involved in stress response
MSNTKNIAIIAHVDHGKTTLVDKILHHCQLFRENEKTGDLILDNNDLERERGITLLQRTYRYFIKIPRSILLILLATRILVVRLNVF